MIQRHQTIANLCHLLQTEYISLLGQRRAGKKFLVNHILSNKSPFPGMDFISVGLPQNVQNSNSFMEIFLQRFVDASARVPPREELFNQVNKLLEKQSAYPADFRLRSVLSFLGKKTTSNYLIIVLQDLAEVSEEPLKDLLLLLREYHNQRNNPGEAGAKLRFLVTGSFRLWNLCFNKTSSSISPFNISKRLFLDGCTYEEIQNKYSSRNIKLVIQLRDLTDGIPTLIDKAVQLQDFEELSVCFAPLQNSWNSLSGYTKELLKKLMNGEEKFPNCRPDYDCPQIPNFELNHSDWVPAFWAGFLKMRYGELAWRSPIHQAFVMAQTDLSANISKSTLLKSAFSDRIERLELALSKLNNPDIFDEVVEELFSFSVQLGEMELISILEMLRNRQEDKTILKALEKVASKSKYQCSSETSRAIYDGSSISGYDFIIQIILLVIKRKFQSFQEVNSDNQIHDSQSVESNVLAISEDQLEAWMNQQAWYSAKFPEYKEISQSQGQLFSKEIDIVIMTATDVESEAVGYLLKPYPRRRKVLKVTCGSETYFLGKFGEYKAVLTQCEMGSNSQGSSTLATEQALRVWKPKVIIMVGIAFGKTPTKQRFGDVLVASGIIHYEPQRVGENLVFRGFIPQTNATLFNRFRNVKGWQFTHPDGSFCNLHYNPVLSGEKLIDNSDFKEALFQQYPQASGGEMEGSGFYSAAGRVSKPCILVKAICDWADGNKDNRYQKFAAASSASLVHWVLRERYILDSL